MENASKALIIAGAILLSVLIISLGIMVYNNAKNTVGNGNLDAQTIQTFNSQWETYKGVNKTASEVESMISAVIANNASETKAGTGKTVNVNGSAPSAVPNIASNVTYTVELEYASSGSGLVTNIKYY